MLDGETHHSSLVVETVGAPSSDSNRICEGLVARSRGIQLIIMHILRSPNKTEQC